jgi:hypothetical protein
MGWLLSMDEIRDACDQGKQLDFSRHPMEVPSLTLCERFYPLGFTVEVRTNSEAILSLAREIWSSFQPCVDNRPIRIDVHVVDDEFESPSEECPPAPVLRMIMPVFYNVADAHNYLIANLEEGCTRIVMTRATERRRSYVDYFLLGTAPLTHIASRHTTPIHAGCVAFKGKGMLLCGDSGAGKSSLSYACARAGWTYTTDDGSYLLHHTKEATVTGNCYQVRFRPSAGELFPEIEGLEITPRAAGKPSIEMPTASLPWMKCAQTASVGHLIFLNRHTGGPQGLSPFRKDVARGYLRQILFGSAEGLAAQYAALDRLLDAEVLELRYTDLDWAVQRLQALAEEGR